MRPSVDLGKIRTASTVHSDSNIIFKVTIKSDVYFYHDL